MASPFRHEHLVRINDPTIERSMWLTRRQLWNGLRHTVLSPQAMDESIDEASVIENADGTLQREIRRGPTTATDEVRLVTGHSLTICADSRGQFCGSTLTIRIEEPAPEMLFVRFTYEVVGIDDECTEEEDNARRSAYQAYDIERVREARLHARSRGH
ncbi:hypothetical protein HNQ60_004630 [Povalibacter uvarum]|uniref:DUF1857 domain-containing protein n=1 Tax=Povalibacter uvarum TaxID=732238 RepID=A0A841HTX4_9GAMM|nr:AtaL-like protein [Povalibacter uvarum]MBB6095739.1 hypothetical protein [Povalibacter uvarum]